MTQSNEKDVERTGRGFVQGLKKSLRPFDSWAFTGMIFAGSGLAAGLFGIENGTLSTLVVAWFSFFGGMIARGRRQ